MSSTVDSLWVFLLIVQMTKFDPVESSIESCSSICCKYGILGILDIFGLLNV